MTRSKMRDVILEEIGRDEKYMEDNSHRYDGDYQAGYLDALAMVRGIINSVTEEITNESCHT